MQLHHKSFKLLITGRSGTGKTTYFERFLSGSQYDRIFIYDHEGEMQLRMRHLPCCKTVEEITESFQKNKVTIFDPCDLFPGDCEAGFRFSCEWVFECSRAMEGTKLFACDELQKLCGTSEMPWEFSLMLETGRRAGLDGVFISQQPNIIHNRIRNLLSEVVTFQHNDQRAIEFLEDVGIDGDQVRALPLYTFIARNLESGAEQKSKLKL